MPSRMEKYYNNNQNRNSRTSRNNSLYDKLYDNVPYSNVESVTTIEKGSEIDLEKIKKLLEDHQEIKEDNLTSVKRTYSQRNHDVYEEAEKDYDIKVALSKAKDEYTDDNKNRSLRNTQYNILKDINIKDIKDDDDNSLKELINTITNTSVLNKLGDKDLSLNMLEDLKSDGKTQMNMKSVDEFIKNTNSDDNTGELDKSFFTSSMSFGNKDFEELNDIKTSLKKNNILISILVFISLAIVITGVLFLLHNIK